MRPIDPKQYILLPLTHLKPMLHLQIAIVKNVKQRQARNTNSKNEEKEHNGRTTEKVALHAPRN